MHGSCGSWYAGRLGRQREMTLAEPVMEEHIGIVCGWTWTGMMDWEVNGWEWPWCLGADKPAVVNCYDKSR